MMRTTSRTVAMVAMASLVALVGCGDLEEASSDGSTTEATEPTGTEAPADTEPAGIGDGVHAVGSDIQPGRHVADISDSDGCYWARLSGFGGTVDEILANDNPAGQWAIVELAESDTGFESSGCGNWQPFDEAAREPVTAPSDGDWTVGVDIQPGAYRTQGSDTCYWERASGFGHATDEIIANGLPTGPAVVEIGTEDARFTTHGCGEWQPA